jgi:hypothetical protein
MQEQYIDSVACEKRKSLSGGRHLRDTQKMCGRNVFGFQRVSASLPSSYVQLHKLNAKDKRSQTYVGV